MEFLGTSAKGELIMRFWELQGYNCAPGIVNGIEEKGKKFLKHSMLNETLLWMLIGMATQTSVKL